MKLTLAWNEFRDHGQIVSCKSLATPRRTEEAKGGFARVRTLSLSSFTATRVYTAFFEKSIFPRRPPRALLLIARLIWRSSKIREGWDGGTSADTIFFFLCFFASSFCYSREERRQALLDISFEIKQEYWSNESLIWLQLLQYKVTNLLQLLQHKITLFSIKFG